MSTFNVIYLNILFNKHLHLDIDLYFTAKMQTYDFSMKIHGICNLCPLRYYNFSKIHNDIVFKLTYFNIRKRYRNRMVCILHYLNIKLVRAKGVENCIEKSLLIYCALGNVWA